MTIQNSPLVSLYINKPVVLCGFMTNKTHNGVKKHPLSANIAYLQHETQLHDFYTSGNVLW